MNINLRKSYKKEESVLLKYVPTEKNSLYIKHYADTVKYNVEGMWKKNILNSNNDIIKTFQNKNNNNTLIKEIYKYDKIKK